jgi:hypothetical protein
MRQPLYRRTPLELVLSDEACELIGITPRALDELVRRGLLFNRVFCGIAGFPVIQVRRLALPGWLRPRK